MKNLNKLCSLACADKKTNNFSNSLVPKRVHSGSVIFYPTCSKPKDKVKVAVGSADLVVWGTIIGSSVGYGRLTKQVRNMIKLPPYQQSVITGLILSDAVWLNKFVICMINLRAEWCLFLLCSAFYVIIDNFILHSSIDIIVLLSVLPIKIYDNADTKKVLILKDNRGKAGVYRWVNKKKW